MTPPITHVRTVPELARLKVTIRTERIAELDGLRALAVWMVLFHHALFGFPTLAEGLSWLPAPVIAVVARGWLGVDLFFILSGFLITGILLDAKGSPAFFRNFYARRFLRIFPLYYTVILVLWICYPSYSSFFLFSTGFLSNFAPHLHVPTPPPATVFWSLAVEEHFYFVWPLLVYGLSRRKLAILAVCVWIGTPCLRAFAFAHGYDPGADIYLMSWFRFDGLALGALIAMWTRSQLSHTVSLQRAAGVLVGAFLLLTAAGAPFGLLQTRTPLAVSLRYNQAQLLFAALLVAALAWRGTALTGVLRSSFARLSSDLSYCLYLVHLGVGYGYLALLGSLDWHPEAYLGAGGAIAGRTVFMLMGSFAVAAISKRYLEDYFLRLKRFFV